MSTHSNRSIRNKILVGASVVAAGAAFMVPSVASAATSTSTSTGDLPARLERACLRIPNMEIRTNNIITRLEGDASTRGSLAWLQAQIDDATAKNRPQRVTVLQNRLKVRTETLQIVKDRSERLQKLADKCRAHGVDI
jgi:hypothetical protein